MSRPPKKSQHLDIRVSDDQMTDILKRVPIGVGLADWVRAELLGQPVQRDRVVRPRVYRNLAPYKDRLRDEALLSIASSLGWIAGSALEPAMRHKLEAVLELVRQEILKETAPCP